jgi:hypothetical protein
MLKRLGISEGNVLLDCFILYVHVDSLFSVAVGLFLNVLLFGHFFFLLSCDLHAIDNIFIIWHLFIGNCPNVFIICF